MDAAIGALRRGAEDFVRKPWHVTQLQRAVHSALRKRELERSNEAMSLRLRASERLHRYLVESSPDLIFTLDADGRFNYLNPRAPVLLGVPRGELLHRTFLSVVWPDDIPMVECQLAQQAVTSEAPFNLQIRLRTPDPTQRSGYVTVALQGMPMLQHTARGAQHVGWYGVARDISEQKRAEEIITFQAYHDHLTHLPNRILYRDRLDQAVALAQRRQSGLAVMFMDVDRFKLVNDSYGHSAGDALLRGIARRLSATLRQGDTLARQGGDEFTLILPDVSRTEDAERIARKILAAMEAPFPLDHGEFRASVSIGIALYPRDGDSSEALIQHADLAMYQVKRSGKNHFHFFEPKLDSHHRHRLSLENDLRQAIERDQLLLHFQPQVSMSRMQAVGMEALLRWRHPAHGMVGPDIFIPLAEELGFIGELGRWVLENACAQLAEWRRMGLLDLHMSLNLSSHDFDRDEIVPTVLDCAARHGIPPQRLNLEITESMMVEDTRGVAARVRRLREAGLGIAIDDFGTGYSALAYLQKFPASTLKIDRSFVRDLDSPATSPIVSAITGIARGFGLEMIAEGVESARQALILRELGCDVMQGYYFSRPLAPADAVAWLSRPAPQAAAT